jgi:hypothetical protein
LKYNVTMTKKLLMTKRRNNQMKLTREQIMYRVTVVCWFLLGVLVGSLGMRVYDMWNYLDKTREPQYMCHKGVAYQTMGDSDEVVYVKTNLQCLDK